MKLKNKKTGEVVELFGISCKGDRTFVKFEDERGVFKGEYNSLAELNAEWEDMSEEPKEYWTIDWICTGVTTNKYSGDDVDDFNKSIGNYFDTKEEAEKAVEKLKAWKRLKDKGFKFNGVTPMEYFIRFTYDKPRQILDNQQRPEAAQQFNKDLDLLFGGEE